MTEATILIRTDSGVVEAVDCLVVDNTDTQIFVVLSDPKRSRCFTLVPDPNRVEAGEAFLVWMDSKLSTLLLKICALILFSGCALGAFHYGYQLVSFFFLLGSFFTIKHILFDEKVS